MRRFLIMSVLVAALSGIIVGSAVLVGPDSHGSEASPISAAALDEAPGTTLRQSITRLQDHLRTQPKDAVGWATLGLAEVEQARVSADPGAYPKAAAAFTRSLAVQPRDNEPALTGQAALAAARHDFTAALGLAGQSLSINPYSSRAQAVRVDALVELGRYPEAFDAVSKADDTKPGIPVFTRYAYVMELRGDLKRAREVLDLAAGSASDPGDTAYVDAQIGDLAWNNGDLATAGRQYDAALRADPQYLPALDGRARVKAARGDADGAIADRLALVRQAPLPAYLGALGELYDAHGKPDLAKQQYAVIGAWNTLAKANGVATDLEMALFNADHGDPAAALQAARAEWNRRCPGAGDGMGNDAGKDAGCSVHVADALAWALHVNGQDREALVHSRQALRTGYVNALFHFHRGMIEKALGHRAQARKELAEALRINPHFSELHAPTARRTLKALE